MKPLQNNGWSAHVEYDVTRDINKIYLVRGAPGDRYRASFRPDGDVLMMRIDRDNPALPTFEIGDDLIGIVGALVEALRRTGYQPDTEAILKTEIATLRGAEAYAKEITDRLLTSVLEMAAVR